MNFTRPQSRAHRAEIRACADCRTGMPGKQVPRSDEKDKLFHQRQVSRFRAGVVLSEAGPGRELPGRAGGTRGEPSGATRNSMAAAGLSVVPRSSVQVRLERDTAPLPASSAGSGLLAPFYFSRCRETLTVRAAAEERTKRRVMARLPRVTRQSLSSAATICGNDYGLGQRPHFQVHGGGVGRNLNRTGQHRARIHHARRDARGLACLRLQRGSPP